MMDSHFEPEAEERIRALESQVSKLQEKNYFLENELKAVDAERTKYQMIADFAQDWEMWIDPKANFVWISPSSNDLTGYTPDEYFKNPGLFYELIYNEDEQKVRHCIHDSITFMQIGQSVEFRILTKTKQLRWCEMNSKAVFDKRGLYLGQRCSIRDITRLKSALGHIREITDTHTLEMKARQRYRDEMAGKDRELVSSLIMIAQKNELVSYIRKNLTVIRTTLPVPMQQKVTAMLEKIEVHQRLQLINWEDFKYHFEKVHQGFFSRLKKRFPKLTIKDQRLCAYLHLGLSTKELAAILNITNESAEIGRIRLRKKLGLTRTQNLNTFFHEV
ncbi:MAG: PAS domain-containing protein [Prolixibacteraceae bacterium]|nr:PAS domain-containing protein [Prolixibacteraceae bacterium]